MSDNSKSSEDEIPLAFVPPLWMQRIDKVKEILAGLKAAEICDLGCGSGKLISELIYFKGINKLIGVDVDSECLVRAVEECNPGVAAYINKRKKKFEIDIFQGSILEPCDQVPFQIEAVTLCEVIEHIYPKDLPSLSQSIFSHINPKHVIITTPNQDFNFYFPDPSKLRHYDHKFEWTQSEFQSWCFKTCESYDYSVSFTGVGLPKGYESQGFCTQIAVFLRNSMKKSRNQPGGTFQNFLSIKIPENFPTNFESRFFNDFLYSFNLVRNWEYLDHDEGISLKKIFRVPCLNMLCDGSEERLLKLITEILPLFNKGFKILDGLIFLDFDQVEDCAEEEFNDC